MLIQLVRTYGDPVTLQRAIESAIPNKEELEELRDEQKQLEQDLKKIGQKRDTLVNKIAEGLFTDNETENVMKKLRTTPTLLFLR